MGKTRGKGDPGRKKKREGIEMGRGEKRMLLRNREEREGRKERKKN